MDISDKFIQTYLPGEAVFDEGSRGDTMFVVQSGTVEILKCESGRSSVLRTLVAGDIFGELALVGDGLRSATAMAGGSGAILVCIDQARFVYLVSQQPAFALCVMKVMAQRLAGARQNEETATA